MRSTPNLESQVIELRGRLASILASQSAKEDAVNSFRSCLSKVWEGNVMFFNYLEGMQFTLACAQVIAEGNLLMEGRIMEAILKAQSVVMTVRGVVRDEYKASMGLSRL